jgi:hypothetical protein
MSNAVGDHFKLPIYLFLSLVLATEENVTDMFSEKTELMRFPTRK